MFDSLHLKVYKKEKLKRLKVQYFIDIQKNKWYYSCQNFNANNKKRGKMNWQAFIVVY